MRDNFVTLLQCYSSIYNHIFTRISTYIIYIYKYIYYIRNICETKLIVFFNCNTETCNTHCPDMDNYLNFCKRLRANFNQFL